MRRALVVSFLVALVGCDGASTADAGPPDAGPPPPFAEAPALTPCREGWLEVVGDDGAARCEPWDGARPGCTGATAPFPGAAGCSPVGEPCGDDLYATGLPAGTVYVDFRATGGDGTRATPFGTFAEAAAGASSGDTIALSRGVHEGPITIPAGVTVRGACAAETVIHAGLMDTGGTVMTTGLGARLEGVHIDGMNPGVWLEGEGVSMALDGVLITGTGVTAVGVFDAEAILRRVAIRNTFPVSGVGRGITVEGASARVDVERASIERVFEIGVSVADGEVALRDVAVLDVFAASTGTGDGINVVYGGSVTAEGLVVEGTETLGMYAFLAGSRIEATDAVIRNGAQDAMQVVQGASASLTRARFVGNAGGSVLAQQSTVDGADLVFEGGRRAVAAQGGATVTIERAVATSTTGGASFISAGDDPAEPSTLALTDVAVWGSSSAGVMIQEGGTGTLTRVEIDEATGPGLVIRGEGTRATVRGVQVTDGRRDEDGSWGRGVEIRVGAHADVEGLRVDGCQEIGVFVEQASASLVDVTATNTREGDPGRAIGRGLEIHESDVTGRAIVANGNVGAGIFTGRLSVVTLEDVVAHDNVGGSLGVTGKGVVANGGAQLTIDGLDLFHDREVSLAAFEEGTVVRITDARIRETLERECAATDPECAEYPAGIGVGSYLGARIELDEFEIASHPLCGVQVADEGDLALSRGRIAENTIGVNVQVADFDYAQVMDRVEYVDNDRNVDGETLPVPGAVDPLAGGL